MRLLLIDTVGLPNIVAYADTATDVIRDAWWKADADEAERILPAIRDVLPADERVEGIICITGPGRFTSTRIGVATCNALAMAWDIPAIGLDRLHFIRTLLSDGEPSRSIAVVSERGDYYALPGTGDDAIGIQATLSSEVTLIDEAAMIQAWHQGKQAFFQRMVPAVVPGTPPLPVIPLYLRAPNITAKKKL